MVAAWGACWARSVFPAVAARPNVKAWSKRVSFWAPRAFAKLEVELSDVAPAELVDGDEHRALGVPGGPLAGGSHVDERGALGDERVRRGSVDGRHLGRRGRG